MTGFLKWRVEDEENARNLYPIDKERDLAGVEVGWAADVSRYLALEGIVLAPPITERLMGYSMLPSNVVDPLALIKLLKHLCPFSIRNIGRVTVLEGSLHVHFL